MPSKNRKRGGRRKKTEPISHDSNLAEVSEKNGYFNTGFFNLSGNTGWRLSTDAFKFNGTIRDHTFKTDGLMGSMIIEFPDRKQLFGFLEKIKWSKCPTYDDGYRRLVDWRR
jgi:hypothetical protein